LHGWALRVVSCESRFDQWAANPTSSARGYFQILAGTWGLHPTVQGHVGKAWEIYQAQGKQAWQCSGDVR
jgi:hypothetical protein